MPDSMISDATGVILNVSGSSMAMVVNGPMPGSTPTSVPKVAPSRQYRKLSGVSATPKPVARWAKRSMSEQRERQFQAVEENSRRDDRQACGDQAGFQNFWIRSGGAGEQGRNEDGRDQSDPVDAAGEYHDGGADDDQRPRRDTLGASGGHDQRTQDRHHADQDQECPHRDGEIS